MKRARQISALALTAALVLSGCGGVGSDPAVTVNGTSYSVSEIQEAVSQLNVVSQEQTGLDQVIVDLGLLPALDEIFTGSPAEQSDTQIRDLLARNDVEDPSETTIEAARSRQYRMMLQDPSLFEDPRMEDALLRAQTITNEDLAAIDVQLNPRFGSWDPATFSVVPQSPDWIVESQPEG